MQNRSSSFLMRRRAGFLDTRMAGAARAMILAFSLGLILNLSLAAAEPILSLRMAKLEIRTERRSPISRIASGTPAAVETAQHVEVLLPRRNEILSFPRSLVLEKPAAERHPLLELSRRSAFDQDAKLWASASIQAGYGEIYPDKTAAVYGHNGTRWEEPSCGYIKIRFRF